ncbi:MAG TPA: hypothetical protein VN445_11650 [Rectinemataceae bacterium]|nr:hypothetical protein [Rectinemataceae bacterium]
MQTVFICAGVQSVAAGKGITIDLEHKDDSDETVYAGGIAMVLNPKQATTFVVGKAYQVDFKELPCTP